MTAKGEQCMKKLAVFVLISALLCCSACGTEQIPPPTPTASPEQQSSEVLVLEARVAELEEELAAALESAANPQTQLGEYAYYSMVYAEPEYAQVIVNCPDGIVTSPVEYGFKCSAPMENEYAEVVAQCMIKANAQLTEPLEQWVLIRRSVRDASEANLGWVPLECVTEYTAENMRSITFPLKVSGGEASWGSVSVSAPVAADAGDVEISYHGGGTATVPAGDILYPTPGAPGWFD